MIWVWSILISLALVILGVGIGMVLSIKVVNSNLFEQQVGIYMKKQLRQVYAIHSLIEDHIARMVSAHKLPITDPTIQNHIKNKFNMN